MGLAVGNMVPPVFFGQCQRLADYSNGGDVGFRAQRHIGRAALEMQRPARCGASAFRENNQAAAPGNGLACIFNQTDRIVIGKETGKTQVSAHKRIAE